MPYRLFTPPGAESPGQDYPLVVFLHGAGERGRDNTAQVRSHIPGLINATQSDEFAAYLLAPQLPSGASWNANGRTDLTMDIIESLLPSQSIDTDRIYVTGLSLGGNGSFNYLQRYPGFFAAAVPMSGWGTPSRADEIADVPQWIFHGDRDSTVSRSGSLDMFENMTAAGGSPLYTEIPNGGHVIWSPIYDDARRETYGLYDWLYAQSLDSTPESQTLVSPGAEWTYWDEGTDPGEEWSLPKFDDSSWPAGPSPLGFGDDGEVTVLRCGPAAPDCSEEKYAAFYFRHDFQWDGLNQVSMLAAQMVRDDGVAVYLNGTEVFRESNVSRNAAFDAVARTPSADNGLVAFTIDPGLLRQNNTLAVEVHQSRDRAVDLALEVTLDAVLVPEPSSLLLAILAGVSLLSTLRNRRRGSTFG